MADSTEAPVEAPAAEPAEAQAEPAEAPPATEAEAPQAPEAAESAPESKKRGRPAGSRDKAPRPPRKKQAVEAEPPSPPSPPTPPLAPAPVPHPKGLPEFAPREIGLQEAWETLSKHLGFHNTAQAKQEWASKRLSRNFDSAQPRGASHDVGQGAVEPLAVQPVQHQGLVHVRLPVAGASVLQHDAGLKGRAGLYLSEPFLAICGPAHLKIRRVHQTYYVQVTAVDAF